MKNAETPIQALDREGFKNAATLVQMVMDRLQYFSDIPIPYGKDYEADLQKRAYSLIRMIRKMLSADMNRKGRER